MKRHNLSLHVFRRDLRIQDNTALLNALKESKTVIPCFIFDPKKIRKHEYQSQNALEFMINSLKELSTALKQKGSQLFLFFGKPADIIEKIHNEITIDAVYFNKDYSPFSKKRDASIFTTCKQLNICVNTFSDLLLNEPDQTTKQDGNPYTIFTPYHNNASLLPIHEPIKSTPNNFYKQDIIASGSDLLQKFKPKKNNSLYVLGGRKEAINILNNLEEQKFYSDQRNIPFLDKTTGLSAHLKFGTVSVREVYYAIQKKLGPKHPIIKQLYWRDFFTHILYHFPHVLQGPFRHKYRNIPWSKNKELFEKWCEGKTGFPIVDAGMRQLNTTGYMHNRVRMIVASFLVKDLHINWQWGEKYFAQKLVDYDVALNNGNWQWASSTGCDAQPYFRIFNPWRQQKKFDLDCKYIKQWIEELQGYSAKQIHALEKGNKLERYVKAIVNHKEASSIAKAMFTFS